jgi:hypothetical protein
MKNNKKQKKDDLTKKIEKIYLNYGIDISDIDEDELERLKQKYAQNKKQLEQDLKESEKHKDSFVDDVI